MLGHSRVHGTHEPCKHPLGTAHVEIGDEVREAHWSVVHAVTNLLRSASIAVVITSDPAGPASSRPLRVCFVVRSLDTGGAERQLVELVRAMPAADFAWTILTFYGGGALEREVADRLNVVVRCLHKRGRWDTATFAMRLLREVHLADPHVVHGSLGVANEAALVAGRLLRRPVVWRIGAAHVDFSLYDWAPGTIFRVGAALSRFPDVVVFNSCAGLEYHRAHGWSPRRMTVIPNGFDLDRFGRDVASGRAVRRAWGIEDDAVLVGIAARLDPIKDHETFFAAAATLAARNSSVRFVCIGDGTPVRRAALQERATALGLDGRLVWAGEYARMADAYSALDVACLTSLGEGLPNAVGEAMCCEVPCVVSDVGDCAVLVGHTGAVVPIRAPTALADSLERLVTLPAHERRELGRQARARIVAHYSRQRYVDASSAMLRAVAAARVAPAALADLRAQLLRRSCG